jgi:creatinine amidohydrolase
MMFSAFVYELEEAFMEVRYERLRPDEIVAQRQACPVAYLPIGTIEWHGEHNPVGLDTHKMYLLLIRCAQRMGGLVFPPLYYGENREEALMEANAADRDQIAAKMGLLPENFALGHMYQSPATQNTNYHHLLLHILHEIRSLGFKVVILGAGHYPLIDHARAAASIFHQVQRTGTKTLVWPFSGYELVQDRFSPAGDHAGKWETSLMMALDPEGHTDLSYVPADPEQSPIGASNNGLQEASAAWGEEAVAAIVDEVEKRVSYLLENHNRLQGHGAPLSIFS